MPDGPGQPMSPPATMTLHGPGSDRRWTTRLRERDHAAAIDGDAVRHDATTAWRERGASATRRPAATERDAAAELPAAAGPADWRPPQHDSGRNASLVFGVIILLVGLWFFATQTLGIDLPRLDWGQLWPIVLIAIGALIVLNAMQRRTR